MKLKVKAVASLALVLLFGSTSTADAAPAFAPKPAATSAAKSNNANQDQDTLILSVPRGGAGPLDPALTAKVFLGACAVPGVYGYLAPNKALELYGVGDVDDASILINGLNGSHLVMLIIAAWGALFVADLSPLQAIGAAQIPVIVTILRSILNGDVEAAGFSMPGWWIDLVIHSFTSHACLSGAGYAAAAVQMLAVYLGLANVQFRLAPGAALKRMGIDDSPSDMALVVTKLMGHQVLEGAVMLAALVSGADAYKSLGYSQIVALLSLIMVIASGDFDKLGAETPYIWILLKAAVILTLAI